MTTLEKISRAYRWRVRQGTLATDETAGWNGCFLVPLEGQLWKVVLGDGMGWRHLSVSNAQHKRLPDWQVMCRLRDAFFADEAWVVQYHPPKAEYINDHPWTLHLWESLDEPMPHPLIVMV